MDVLNLILRVWLVVLVLKVFKKKTNQEHLLCASVSKHKMCVLNLESTSDKFFNVWSYTLFCCQKCLYNVPVAQTNGPYDKILFISLNTCRKLDVYLEFRIYIYKRPKTDSL